MMTNPYWDTLEEVYKRFCTISLLYNSPNTLRYEDYPLLVDDMNSNSFVDESFQDVYTIDISNPHYAGITLRTNQDSLPVPYTLQRIAERNTTFLLFDSDLNTLLELDHHQFIKIFDQAISINFIKYDVRSQHAKRND